jgi:GNAT superfamily N-acetyltransferase
LSTIDNLRSRIPWLPARGSDTSPIELLTAAAAREIRLPWASRFSRERLLAQVAANPGLSLWIPETGEYALAGPWRHRDEIVSVLEATTRKGYPRLVGALVERAREDGYELMVVPDEVLDTDRKLYSALGFTHLERVVILKRSLKPREDFGVEHFPQVEMRRARHSDIEMLLRVDHASFPWLWWNSRHEFEVYEHLPEVYIYLALLGGEPVGYTSFTMYDGWAHLDRIAVVEGRHGTGLGAGQLARVLAQMSSMGAGYVALSTQVTNTRSHRLYERFGFHNTGERMDFFGMKL